MTGLIFQACVSKKIDELFVKWLNEEATVQALSHLASSVKASKSLPNMSWRTVSETSPSRDAYVLAKRGSSPPRGPSPSSPSASPKSSPMTVRRKQQKRSQLTEVGATEALGDSLLPISVKLAASQLAQSKSPTSASDSATSSTTSSTIPQFYFPNGKPSADAQADAALILSQIRKAFSTLQVELGEKGFRRNQFGAICSACRLPVFWKYMLHFAVVGDNPKKRVSFKPFFTMWKRLTATYHDRESQFVMLLTQFRRRSITFEDLLPLVQCIVDDFPGLTFLREPKVREFIKPYIETVRSRIFYSVSKTWTGRITIPELRQSNLLNIIEELEGMATVNEETNFFSYEHFYVIYCKFFELDCGTKTLDIQDLNEYGDYGLSKRILERVLSKAVRPYSQCAEGEMNYLEFVWFMLAEEEKTTTRSIEYWFRCMDLDGDGVLSMYELEHFHEDFMDRLRRSGHDPYHFKDCLCHLLDMVKPRSPNYITLSDLKRCGHAKIFFNTLLNFNKFCEQEQRDPFATLNKEDPEGDWERYARVEYRSMIQFADDPSVYGDEIYGDAEDPQLMALIATDDEVLA